MQQEKLGGDWRKVGIRVGKGYKGQTGYTAVLYKESKEKEKYDERVDKVKSLVGRAEHFAKLNVNYDHGKYLQVSFFVGEVPMH